MDKTILLSALEWFSAISGIVAALTVALDIGRKATGWGFVLFVFSSITWITYGLLKGEGGLTTQNVALFAINVFGVYRYLIRKRPSQHG